VIQGAAYGIPSLARRFEDLILEDPDMSPNGSTFDAFLQLDGIPGESTDDKHKDWIEIVSFNHGVTQPVSSTRSSAGGATTGRAAHDDFTFSCLIDKAYPKLVEAASSGKHLSKAKLEVCRAGGQQVKFLEINFEQVLVSNVHLSGSGNGSGDQLPGVSFSLNYGKVEWIYTQQKRSDGSGGGNVTAKHDLTTGKGS
jgi:type VI secretion system secreted protein Hcp